MARNKSDAIIAIAAAGAAAQVFKKGFTARFASTFSRLALRRGMNSGSKAWLYAGAAASGFKLVQAVVGKKPEVTRIKLRRGESIQITEVGRAK